MVRAAKMRGASSAVFVWFEVFGSHDMHKARKVGGFTLIEMLVVLVLIGLLAGLVGPKLFGKVDSSKVQTAQTQVKMIKGALAVSEGTVGDIMVPRSRMDLLDVTQPDGTPIW